MGLVHNASQQLLVEIIMNNAIVEGQIRSVLAVC